MSNKTKNNQQNTLNILNSIISSLPDNRPIKSLQIVEEHEKCPENFTPIYKSYDQDQVADLWRENILFASKRTCRFLCLSKSEGLQDYIVEDLKIIGEKELAPEGYSMLTRTADNDQKAWRKKQLIYKLKKIDEAKHFITDIILCSKFKTSPEGFISVGDLNGILVCYKTNSVTKDLPNFGDLRQSLDYINVDVQNSIVPQKPTDIHYYEVLKPSYKLSPSRSAPQPPTKNLQAGGDGQSYKLMRVAPTPPTKNISNTNGTLNLNVELDGIQFIINSRLTKENFVLPCFEKKFVSSDLEYDFNLEREVLCTSKTSNHNVKNPFFH